MNFTSLLLRVVDDKDSAMMDQVVADGERADQNDLMADYFDSMLLVLLLPLLDDGFDDVLLLLLLLHF